MFLKSLIITHGDGTIIRDIQFHAGLNLIVDETPVISGKETGNNVGKTTVLKLIDFCLGGDAKEIYADNENVRNEYKIVKKFLAENQVLISLVLKDDLAQKDSREILIERNFHPPKKSIILRINGDEKTDAEIEPTLGTLLFPGHYRKKPTCRQMISHNIRYKDMSTSNTLKTLNRYTRDDEYETLYLFLLGCDFEQGDMKQDLRTQIEIEEKFKRRLESEATKSAYETALALLQSDIEKLELKKASLNLNPNFESGLNKLNEVKYQVNLISSEICRLKLRESMILETQKEMQSGASNIDMQQLQQIYQQATTLVSGIQKTFQELCAFHNQMVESKVRFIAQDLPKINAELAVKHAHLKTLLDEEAKISATIIQSDSFDVLEELIVELNTSYQKKGEYENTLRQLNSVESKLKELNNELTRIDSDLYSATFSVKVQEQLNKFNQHFSAVSHELYGEKYALEYKIKTSKTGRRLYEFSPINLNFSSGKKQGEISCFDIAYTLFANEQNIPCMHFLLNDKKELMHDNQLLKISDFVNANGIQFVMSILKDKLPTELNKEEYIVLKLSQEDKLFRIEQMGN